MSSSAEKQADIAGAVVPEAGATNQAEGLSDMSVKKNEIGREILDGNGFFSEELAGQSLDAPCAIEYVATKPVGSGA